MQHTRKTALAAMVMAVGMWASQAAYAAAARSPEPWLAQQTTPGGVQTVNADDSQSDDPLFAGLQNLGTKAKESNEVNLD